jgi:hypothetical protein
MTRTNRTPKKRRETKARTRVIDWKPAFLKNLRESGNIGSSCRKAHVGRTKFYEDRKADADFAAQVAEALEDAGDVLEAEAWRRAVKGVKKPVYGRDDGPNAGTVQVGEVVEYSDTLLIFLLKVTKPEKYRERHEISGPGGGPIPFREVVAELTPEAGASDEESARPLAD